MASIQEPEVQLAQRLASNERPIRTKAIKKLRKYIRVRSQKSSGGFTNDELLKLWKGLFYCLWMQDKPLLQEELSQLISGLIHSFHDLEGQLLYLKASLQTFKREWTGIDRLRMDKFFQLVRFIFRQAFELLRRKNWDSSAVGSFLDLVSTEILHGDSEAPAGLQFHILDLYMTELAAVGSQELTADQNLTFIEPFCKTAAKTKDRTLFRAICGSFFSAIIDQAPYAIEDLMKELKAAQDSDSDSGQASEEEEEEEVEKKECRARRKEAKKGRVKQINGHKSHQDDDDDEDEDLLHLEESDSEFPLDDEDIGPVLQFDYTALADKLLELSSRSFTPSENRKRLYGIIKVLRDLSEGIFPQDEYPEEVSTDEDDDMFGTRKRVKKFHHGNEEEEEAPGAKKRKVKTKASDGTGEPAASGGNKDEEEEKQKKKKKRKKKKKKAGPSGEEASKQEDGSEAVTQSDVNDEAAAASQEASGPEPSEKEEEMDQEKEVEVSTPDGAASSGKKKKRKKKKKSSRMEERRNQLEAEPVAAAETKEDAGEKTEEDEASKDPKEDKVDVTPVEFCGNTPMTRRKKKLQEAAAAAAAGTAPPPLPESQGVAMTTAKRRRKAADESEGPPPDEKTPDSEEETPGKRKKRRKIPVVFEFEAEEAGLGAEPEQAPPPTAGKKKKKKKAAADFASFQRKASVPTPLFCRTKGRVCQAPSSESKKVTFRLKNNKTAEFRKTDRSLLLSPDGTSRVAFDPAQKPKTGVLKSPLAAPTTSAGGGRKKGRPAKPRPTAADFF